MLTSSRRLLFRAQKKEDNIASLETDVMRFMAIFAFCLMAIFALVQSTDYSQSHQNFDNKHQLLLQKNHHQREEIVAQEKEILKLKLEKRALELNNIEKITKVSPVLKNNLTKAVKKPPELKLSFKSDEDLLALLKDGNIQIFISNSTDSLQLEFHQDEFSFRRVALSGQYYPMSKNTVPIRLIEKTPENYDEAKWYVVLPSSVILQVKRLMRSETHGEIVIKSDLSVDILKNN